METKEIFENVHGSQKKDRILQLITLNLILA